MANREQRFSPIGSALEGLAGGLGAFMEARLRRDAIEAERIARQQDIAFREKTFVEGVRQAKVVERQTNLLNKASIALQGVEEMLGLEQLGDHDVIKQLQADLNVMRERLAGAQAKVGRGDVADTTEERLKQTARNVLLAQDILDTLDGTQAEIQQEIGMREATAQRIETAIDNGDITTAKDVMQAITDTLGEFIPALDFTDTFLKDEAAAAGPDGPARFEKPLTHGQRIERERQAAGLRGGVAHSTDALLDHIIQQVESGVTDVLSTIDPGALPTGKDLEILTSNAADPRRIPDEATREKVRVILKEYGQPFRGPGGGPAPGVLRPPTDGLTRSDPKAEELRILRLKKKGGNFLAPTTAPVPTPLFQTVEGRRP